MFLLAFFTLCLILLSHTPSYANEPLIFSQNYSERSGRLIEKTFRQSLHDIRIAKTDLNQDGLPEFIIKSAQCQSPQICSFDIVAEIDNELIQLAKINARKIELASDYSYGVRNLWVYQDKINDFKHLVYTWDPAQSQYIMSR